LIRSEELLPCPFYKAACKSGIVVQQFICKLRVAIEEISNLDSGCGGNLGQAERALERELATPVIPSMPEARRQLVLISQLVF
jgi:hypothetical protein